MIADFEETPNSRHFHSPGGAPIARHGLSADEMVAACRQTPDADMDSITLRRVPISKPVHEQWSGGRVGVVEHFTMLVVSVSRRKTITSAL